MIQIKDILKQIPHQRYIGNPNQIITKLLAADSLDLNSTSLCWCSNKNEDLLKNIISGTIICSPEIKESNHKKECNYIIVDNPRLAFKRVIEIFFSEKEQDYSIAPSAQIHPTAKISNYVTIGHNVVIEENVQIGSYSKVGPNTVLLKNTIIGDHVTIGCNNTIGGVGFGYEKNEQNEYELIPHIGNVVIEDNVDIGNNSAIDRAVLGSTYLKNNCKIDNLVHIAHGAIIGENSLVIANSMIAGSVKIGKNVWVAPSSSILNKKIVADNAVIGMGSVVLKDVNENETIVGNPGKKLNK